MTRLRTPLKAELLTLGGDLAGRLAVLYQTDDGGVVLIPVPGDATVWSVEVTTLPGFMNIAYQHMVHTLGRYWAELAVGVKEI